MAEKRKYPVVPCPECIGHMKRARANQRRCLTCRLGKNAGWIDGRTAKCKGCGQKYLPWGRPAQWSLCGHCLLEKMAMGFRESVQDECAYHKRDEAECRSGAAGQCTWVYSQHIRICFPCLTDPKHFKENQRVILAKVKMLQEARIGGTVEGKQ